MQNSLYISNSKKIKRILKIFSFIIIFTIVLKIITGVLSVKASDGIAQWDVFYEIEKNSLDVLVLGSSHAYVNINPVVMFEENGIAAFNLCGSMQPMWNSYYFLKEALKYQKPKLVILEGYGTCYNDNYTEYGEDVDCSPRIIKNNFGMKWSLNKIESIINSAPEGRKAEFLIELIQCHNRYEELTAWDFYDLAKYPEGKTWRGQADRNDYNACAYPVAEILNSTEIGSLTPKTEEYYRKILQLANEEGIELKVVLTPYPSIKMHEKAILNKAKLIADEYGVEFVDFNTDEYYEMIGVDFSSDFVDGVHMNYIGNEKYSRFFAKYLETQYDLPDRRGNEVYIDWEKEIQVRNDRILKMEENSNN